MHHKSSTKEGFQLKGQSKEFAARQNDLFNVLDILENKSNNNLNDRLRNEAVSTAPEDQTENSSRVNLNRYLDEVKQNTYMDFPKKSNRNETKSLRGKESIFKRPEAPISKCLPLGRVPGFRKNPHNWTKYSLNDVEDMSDKSNTAAAMSFLKEIQSRKIAKNNLQDDMSTDSDKKILFNKTVLIKDTSGCSTSQANSLEEAEDEKVTFRSSKVIMPEYVIGQKRRNKNINKDNKNKTNLATKQLKLDHLVEEEDEESS